MSVRGLAPVLRFVLGERGWTCPDRLARMAERLPAVATAGLELPLAGEGSIDLQQRIRGPAEIRRLMRWLARSAPSSEPWRRLGSALATIGEAVDELWLELDDNADDPPLSVFARIREAPAALTAPTITRILEAFDVRLPAARRAALDRCLAACESGARISHLGLMLGRPGAPLRLIVEGIRPEDVADLLARSGWPGATSEVEAWSDRLFVHADRIRLAFTLANTLTADMGLECFVGEPTSKDPRWRCLFDILVQQGLCSAVQRDRLLAWPALLTPVSASEWPEELLIDALLRDEPAARSLECRMSHIKVSLAAERPPSAKGYFGFIQIQDDPVATQIPRPQAASEGIGATIDAASAFLLAAHNQAGWWVDYDGFSEGPADEWVTAYVAHALHSSLRPGAREAAARAWHLLACRARSGWGWNFLQPADADSTIWGLALAADLGMLACDQGREAIMFLRSHMQADGGVATYRRDHYRDWSDSAVVNPAWYEPHACVTAAAAQLACLGRAPLDYLRRAQRSDGTWRGYWWQSDTYTTALAAEALAATGDASDSACVARAAEATVAWLDRAANRDALRASPFEAALALRTLLQTPAAASDWIGRTRDILLGARLTDGSWCGSAALSIPNKRGELATAIDTQRCFTTATVLQALLKLEALEAKTAPR